jgi:hypothetical protein
LGITFPILRTLDFIFLELALNGKTKNKIMIKRKGIFKLKIFFIITLLK